MVSFLSQQSDINLLDGRKNKQKDGRSCDVHPGAHPTQSMNLTSAMQLSTRYDLCMYIITVQVNEVIERTSKLQSSKSSHLFCKEPVFSHDTAKNFARIHNQTRTSNFFI